MNLYQAILAAVKPTLGSCSYLNRPNLRFPQELTLVHIGGTTSIHLEWGPGKQTHGKFGACCCLSDSENLYTEEYCCWEYDQSLRFTIKGKVIHLAMTEADEPPSAWEIQDPSATVP